MYNKTTIVSVATPLSSEGAIGIIRISGDAALQYADSVFVSKQGRKLSDFPVQKMVYGHIKVGGRVYDEVLAVYFRAPRSYTGEQLVEIHCHGNISRLMEINSLFIELGASPAEAGEFTKRAFLNGRIDLSQAEAVMDLISAKTNRGFDLALSQLKGSFSREIEEELEQLTDLLARIEVTIDYPDEDIEVVEKEAIRQALLAVLPRLEGFMANYDRGKLMRDGLSVAIVGSPNVGKSSLMNFLLKEDRAIVTDIAGTTRDVLREWVNFAGFPIHLIDTAGIRQTGDLVEQIGVEKSKESFNEADLILVVLSADASLSEDEKELLELAKDKKCIVLINKIDLEQRLFKEEIARYNDTAKVLEVSVRDRIGMEDLEEAFTELMESGALHAKGGDFILNQRQYASIVRAKQGIETALRSLDAGMPLDIIEVDLINSYDALGEVIGKKVDIDVIDRIFEKFCLGK